MFDGHVDRAYALERVVLVICASKAGKSKVVVRGEAISVILLATFLTMPPALGRFAPSQAYLS